MACRRGLYATADLRSLVVFLYILNITTAYQYVPNSPCEPQCKEGTLTEDAVCLDEQYRDTPGGSRLETCVGCLLNSTAVDTANNQSDVEWGLCMKVHGRTQKHTLTQTRYASLHLVVMHVRRSRSASIDLESMSSVMPATERLRRIPDRQQYQRRRSRPRLLQRRSLR